MSGDAYTSISKRFSYTLIAITTLMLLIFAISAMIINFTRAEDQLEKALTNSLKLAEAALRIPVWNVDYYAAQGFVDSLLLDEQIVFATVVVDGENIATNARKQHSDMAFDDFSRASQFMSGDIEIRHQDESIGVLQLVMSRAEIRETVLINVIGILLLTVLIIAAIALTSIMISRRYIATPLAKLQHSASAIASGDLEASIDVAGKDEVGNLARNFDVMRQSIKDLIAALQEANRQQFRKILDVCPAGLLILDQAGRLVFHNQSFRTMLGYDDHELEDVDTRRFWTDLDQHDQVNQLARERHDQLINQEVSWRRKDGQPLEGLLSYTQIDQQGELSSFSGGSRIAWFYDISEIKNAEEARRRSEQRLVDAIDAIGEGFCLYDENGRLVLFNRHYKDSFPGNVDIIKEGTSFREIATAVAKSGQLKAAVGREDAWIEERLEAFLDPPAEPAVNQRMDGRWMQISERRTLEGGRVGVFTDVTEIKQREEELARLSDRLQLALSMEGVGIWDVDLVNDKVWWSNEYTTLMRYDPETYQPTPTTWEEHLHPDEAADTNAKVDAFLASGETVMRLPEHFVRGDGSEIWVESLMRVQRDADGRPIRLSGLDVDITAQLEREQQLERVSERLSLAMQIDEVGIYDADFKAGTLWWSPEYTAMLGHDPETFVPVPPVSWEERLHPDSADAIKAQIQAFIESDDETMRLRQHLQRADQQDIWVDSVMRIQRDDQGEATRLTGLAVDISEQLKRERALDNANRSIMESLRYAGRIQSAMLPAEDAIARSTGEHFLIWEPRDIVGGDFFWHHPIQGGYCVIVGDCTGHGVPGAFMTLIACGFLDRALASGADRPSQVLSDLHQHLKTLLGQDGAKGDTDDGLEAGVCFISDTDKKLVFSGARFSLFRKEDSMFAEIRGDKAGIGYRRTAADAVFNDIALDLNGEDAFYMTTDGLIDQIGGERRRSFGKKRFLSCLADHADDPLPQQAATLKKRFDAYQGAEVRRDDVTVLGFTTGIA